MLEGGIAAAGDLAEESRRQPPCLVGRDSSAAADHDPPAGCLPAAVTGAVADDEGLGSGGMNTNPEAHELVVPGDPGRVGRLERIGDPLG